MVNVAEERERVVAEAVSWLRTPYGHHQRLKGVEVDCAGFLVEVYERAGIVEHVELPPYTRDWFNHVEGDAQNIYSDYLAQWAVEIQGAPARGDVVAFQWGKCRIAHAGIVCTWPDRVILASSIDRPGDGRRGQVTYRECGNGPLAVRISGFWSPMRWQHG